MLHLLYRQLEEDSDKLYTAGSFENVDIHNLKADLNGSALTKASTKYAFQSDLLPSNGQVVEFEVKLQASSHY